MLFNDFVLGDQRKQLYVDESIHCCVTNDVLNKEHNLERKGCDDDHVLKSLPN